MATNYHEHYNFKTITMSMTISNPISSPSTHSTAPMKLNAIKDGYLHKESQFMKINRKRWIVLTPKYLYSYKTKTSITPTEKNE